MTAPPSSGRAWRPPTAVQLAEAATTLCRFYNTADLSPQERAAVVYVADVIGIAALVTGRAA